MIVSIVGLQEQKNRSVAQNAKGGLNMENTRVKKITELRKKCPVCQHVWILRHDKVGILMPSFLRQDFAWAAFKHLQTHTSGLENRVKCYEYNGAFDEA